MSVRQPAGYLKQQLPAIREQLLNGTYKPQPVKRVEIPKPDGGVRKLGIPTVLNRFIQQAAAKARPLRLPRNAVGAEASGLVPQAVRGAGAARVQSATGSRYGR